MASAPMTRSRDPDRATQVNVPTHTRSDNRRSDRSPHEGKQSPMVEDRAGVDGLEPRVDRANDHAEDRIISTSPMSPKL